MPEITKKPQPAPAAEPQGGGKKSPPKKAAPAPAERPVLYPEVTASVCQKRDGTALTAEQAKALLGWREESETEKFGQDFLFTLKVDGKETKVVCDNNAVPGKYSNRPIDWGRVEQYVQELLNGTWELNCENVIVSLTGLVLDGQHRLIALVVAELERTGRLGKDRERLWKEKGHADPVVLETLVAYGASEDRKVVATMNTGKPRTLADVFYQSEHFQKLKPQVRQTAAKYADGCVRLLWERTGMRADSFSPRLTTHEALDFVQDHPKVVATVSHVLSENDEGQVSRYVSPGYAAALCYLMGCCNSDPDRYKGDRTEAALKWDNWTKAKAFWSTVLPAGKLNAVDRYLAELKGEGGDVRLGRDELCGVLVKAWNEWSCDGAVTERTVRLPYEERTHDDGYVEKFLAKHPVLGGIDRGPRPEKEDEAYEEPEEVSNGKPQPPTVKQQLKALKADYPDRTLLFKAKEGGGYKAWGEDALQVAGLFGKTRHQVAKADGLYMFAFADDQLLKVASGLKGKAAVVTPDGDDGYKVNDLKPKAEPRGKPKPKAADPGAEPAPVS